MDRRSDRGPLPSEGVVARPRDTAVDDVHRVASTWICREVRRDINIAHSDDGRACGEGRRGHWQDYHRSVWMRHGEILAGAAVLVAGNHSHGEGMQ